MTVYASPGRFVLADRIAINTRAARFPAAWVKRITASVTHEMGDHPAWRQRENDLWTKYLDRLSSADKGGISPDAGDGEICAQAELTANDFARRIRHVRNVLERGARFAAVRLRYGLRAVAMFLADYCRELLAARDLADMWPVGKGITRAGAVARMQCVKFWRRVYRVLHARTVEACAIDLGLVHKNAGLYCSHDAVKRRRGQNARNAASLDSVTAVNDHGQAYTLAELAAKGTANKAIRRAELMTRIAGFDLISQDLGHEGALLTLTCPSRMHKMTTHGGTPVENRKWDGTTPREAQQYLCKQWARMRAAAARRGLDWYGFRIAEPQQDGTPHWHVLLFYGAGRGGEVVSLAREYFLLNDSATEAGAEKHRVDFEKIDPKKGSACAYVAKYISKNIDGYGVGTDLFGTDAVESSARVEAWAATWRIRQFQQVGGPPVTVWRELRRIHPDNVPAAAPEALRSCVIAMNLQKTEPGLASAAWKRYVKLQGGPCAGRSSLTVVLLRDISDGSLPMNGYGERTTPAVVGVTASAMEESPASRGIRVLRPTAAPIMRRLQSSVESERAEWIVVPVKDKPAAVAMAALAGGAAARPWTRVNNCTPAYTGDGSRIIEARTDVRGNLVPEVTSGFGPRVERRPKLRKFMNWGVT